PRPVAVPEAAASAPAEKKIPAVAPPPPAPPAAPSASPSTSAEAAAPASGSGAAAPAAADSGSGSSRNPRDDAPASTHFGSDDLLKDIYSRETAAHVATVRAFIERERGKPAPHLLTEELYRACHTLSGSSKMAEARHGTRLAEPLDHWLRKAYSNGSGVGIVTPDLDLLADCMTAMESVASHLDEATGFFLTHEGLRARIAQAEAALDHRVTEAAKHAADVEAAANAHTSTIAQETAERALAGELEPESESMPEPGSSSEPIQSIDSLLASDLSSD